MDTGRVPPVARVEPLTTARALRGPFDYLRPEGVEVGSLLVVPFGRRDVLGVVVGLAEESEVADDRLVAPREVLDAELPADLVELALWMAAEYCSTPARGALARLAAPRRDGAHDRAGGRRRAATAASERSPTRQRALLASLSAPRVAGADLPALRRLERRGLVRHRAPRACAAPPSTRPSARGGRSRRRSPPTRRPRSPRSRRRSRRATGAAAAARRHRLGQDRGLPAGRGARRSRAGRGAIVLVPEIALTPQIVSRFVERFGDTVAVLHSRLSAGRAPRRVAPAARAARRGSASARARRCSRRSPTSGWSSSTRSTTPPTSTRATRATTPARVAAQRARRPRRRAARRQRDAAARERQGAAAAAPARSASTARRCRRSRSSTCAARDGALHPRTRHALARRAQGDRAAQPPRLVELPDLPRLRPRVECPDCDVVARPAPRGTDCSPATTAATASRCPTRCPTCGSVSIGAPRHRHRAPRARARARSGTPVLPPRRRRRRRAARCCAAFERAERGVLVGTQMVAKGHDFPDVDARRGARRRRHAALPRLPRRGAHVRARRPARRPRGPRRRRRPRARADARARRARRSSHAARHDADGFLAGELAPPRGAALPAVLDADPGRLLAPRSRAPRGRGGDARRAGALEHATVLGPAPLFRLRGRERARCVVKATTAPRRDRRGRRGGRRRGGRARTPRRRALSVDVDPQ